MKPLNWLIFGALLSVGATYAAAQPELPGAQTPADEAAGAPDGENPAAPESSGAAAGDDDAAEAAGEEEAGTEVVSSDDRFIPSTQISEDLSVSFPVDI